ncbi:NAD(P)/FAD-dependent oxidoreductase [Gordonia sp. TBRC 11910]|uniref:NADH:ubiquinone reductase (non-electrogenic) n=1 Tax=Gordonia asplenii TaxID=2725283 RepID=A0A848KWU2_9ACTN|nr:NAD(P)/FAD-dependent oxidoreductase [Gordonia asplenii]NMO02779.1 NAD(P)/FAD-dependent oxidoreductase [Gordonia asplenii]
MTTTAIRHHTADVVIVGSGFGGIAAARRLARRGYRALIVSETQHYLFQPLLYQVATGILDPEIIATATQDTVPDGVDTLQARVTGVDAAAQMLYATADGVEVTIGYNWLIAATGAAQAYFGRPEFAEYTFALKTADDAKALRDHIHEHFVIAADTSVDADTRRRAASFVIVGAGATGVETAGEIAELAKRHFHQEVHITLVDGAADVLPAYGGTLSAYARERLTDAGITVLTAAMVTDLDATGATIQYDGATTRLDADTIIWAAGVRAADFAGALAETTGCDTDRAGRLLINTDLTVGGYANVFAIGDMTSLHDYPGQSPVAMQQGRHAADTITGKIKRGTEFRYFDKGSMAMLNRLGAVTNVRDVIKLTGPLAWITWLAVHLYYLAGLKHRTRALVDWARAFVGRGRPGYAVYAPIRVPEDKAERIAA